MRGAPFGSTAEVFGVDEVLDVVVLGFDEVVEFEEVLVEPPVAVAGFAAEAEGLFAVEVFEEDAEDFELSEVAALTGTIATAEAIRTQNGRKRSMG